MKNLKVLSVFNNLKDFRVSVVLIAMVSFIVMGSVVNQAQAAIGFSSLTEQNFTDLSKEFSANFMHKAGQGAAGLGSIFGFEFGIMGGTTATPKLDAIVKASSAGNSLGQIANFGLYGALTIPFGLTGEIAMVPKMGGDDGNFQSTSMALKISIDELIPVLPLNFSTRLFSTTSKFSFVQAQSGVSGTVDNKNAVTGVQLLLSPKIPFLEPYGGIGFINAKNDLEVTGTGTVFDVSVTSAQASSTKVSTTQLIVGFNAKLVLMSLGVEYSKAFDTSSVTGKFGFGF
jgi:hypothetical protein